MKLCCGLMEGQFWEATLKASVEGRAEGGLVVVLSNEEILSPQDAEFGEFSIVEASADERKRLEGAGYTMPDWSALQGLACGARPTGSAEGDPPPENIPEPEE